MFSGALAGFLKVAAVGLTAGGLATGVYFLVQVGQEEDAPRLQVPVTATAPAPATPTAPVPTATPPAVDTSNWQIYSSPLGFSIKYPPDWSLEELPPPASNPPGVDPGKAIWIMNPVFSQLRQQTLAGQRPPHVGDVPGTIKIEIHVFPAERVGFPARFDPVRLTQLCENQGSPPDPLEGPPDVAEETVFAGRRAVVCRGTDLTAKGEPVEGTSYWIEFTGGRTFQFSPLMFQPSSTDAAKAAAVAQTLTFQNPP